jgi:DNA-binding NtrC family response regulator
VVEDEVIVALDLVMQLQDEGYECLGPARTTEDALALIEASPPDFAVLDVNLDGESSVEIARRLSELGTPFAYVSGYGERGVVEEMPAGPLLQKPLRFDRLKDALSEALA